MYRQTMKVSTSLSKMRFQTTPQNEEKVWVVTKSAAHPETRNSDSAELGSDRSRMIGHRQTILNLDLVRVEEEASMAEDEAEDGAAHEVGEEVEVEEASGLEKTNGCLPAAEPEDIGGFQIGTLFQDRSSSFRVYSDSVTCLPR
jgi:hypothetical protein